MPGFLKKKRTWIGLLLVIVLAVGFMLFQSAAKTKKAEQEKAAATKVDSPYAAIANGKVDVCLLYTSPSPRDQRGSRMPSSA